MYFVYSAQYTLYIIAGGRRDRIRAFLGVLAARWPPVLSRPELAPVVRPGGVWRALQAIRPGVAGVGGSAAPAPVAVDLDGVRDQGRRPPGPSARSGQLRRDQLRPPSADRRRLLRVRPGAPPAARFLPGRRRRLLPIRFFGARLFRLGQFFRARRFSSFFDFPPRPFRPPGFFRGAFLSPLIFPGRNFPLPFFRSIFAYFFAFIYLQRNENAVFHLSFDYLLNFARFSKFYLIVTCL